MMISLWVMPGRDLPRLSVNDFSLFLRTLCAFGESPTVASSRGSTFTDDEERGDGGSGAVGGSTPADSESGRAAPLAATSR